MRFLLLSLACALTALSGISANAQISLGNSSSRTSVIVGYAAGGGGDAIARLLQPDLQVLLNQTVIVENFPGAGGIIAAKRLLGNPADGQTINFGGPIETVIAPETMPAATYKSQDFRPIIALVNSRTALLARPDIPVKDVAELITWAKSQNRPISYGSFGVGNIYHLFGEQFTKATGLNTLHVPYAGGASPLVTALMGGHIDIAFISVAGNVASLVTSGKLKALGVASTQAPTSLPNLVPLSKQSPLLHDFNFDLWTGFNVRSDTPEATVLKLHEIFAQLSVNPEIRKRLEGMGLEMFNPMSQKDLDAFFASEVLRHRSLVKAANLKLN